MKKIFLLSILTLATFTFAQENKTSMFTANYVPSSPSEQLLSQKKQAEKECRKLFDHIRCSKGIYFVGGAGAIGGIGGQVSWINIGIQLSAGISFANLVEVGVDGEGIVYPLVYQTYNYGMYAKLRPFNGFFIGGRYYHEPAGYFDDNYYTSHTYSVEAGVDAWFNNTAKSATRAEIYLKYGESDNGRAVLQLGLRMNGMFRLFGKHKQGVSGGNKKMLEEYSEDPENIY